MEGAKDFVYLINGELEKQLALNGITGALFHGISENVISKNQQFPVVFRGKDGRWSGFDDTKPVVGYHKIESVNVTIDAESGYGDKAGDIVNTYNMKLVIFSDTLKTKLSSDELFTFIQANMPEAMRGEKFSYIRTTIRNAILNVQQVFNAEYRGFAFSLRPEQSLISIGYIIEGRFKKGCFKCCS